MGDTPVWEDGVFGKHIKFDGTFIGNTSENLGISGGTLRTEMLWLNYFNNIVAVEFATYYGFGANGIAAFGSNNPDGNVFVYDLAGSGQFLKTASTFNSLNLHSVTAQQGSQEYRINGATKVTGGFSMNTIANPTLKTTSLG